MLLILPMALLAAPQIAHGAANRSGAVRDFGITRAFAIANDREQDGLTGPVRRVKTETAKLEVKNGKTVEGPRALLETITYNNKGARIDSAYFLTPGGTLTGKEVYKYDDKGNMVEMTLHKEDGTLLAKEVYAYEFDAVGNWVKMTTSVAVIEGGKLTFEPTEVTYRTIAYYLEETMVAKMSQPAPQPAAGPASASPPVADKPQSPAAEQKSPAAHSGNTQQSAARPADSAVEKPADRVADKNTAADVPLVVASLDKGAPAADKGAQPAGGDAQPASEQPDKPEGDAAAKTAARGPLKPVSGGILNGKALSLPPPQYPDIAKRARINGTVEVEVVIDPSGKVISAKAVRGPAMLQQAAEQAARQAKFLPTLLSGQPVKVSGVITYNFNLM